MRQFLLVTAGIIFGILIYGTIDSLANNDQENSESSETVDDSLKPVSQHAIKRH